VVDLTILDAGRNATHIHVNYCNNGSSTINANISFYLRNEATNNSLSTSVEFAVPNASSCLLTGGIDCGSITGGGDCSGALNISLRVDEGNMVLESNETNNNFVARFAALEATPTPTPTPVLTPTPTPTPPAVAIASPFGTVSSNVSIPLNFSASGATDCVYNLNSTGVSENFTIAGCLNTTFSVPLANESYRITVYAAVEAPYWGVATSDFFVSG
jgi:hypothetical protein